ncbi:hypothetical protein B6U90_02080 [Thermoplasmatales archaeon ex4484_6]|nr:MAG: hypothetical protein B6U90_02080 [Thermoplasmatales archaeon ex4484_6]
MRKILNNKKGEMGIGTMILFIAMVLVAAVAAALLISTAGSLNQQAQETGRLTQQEISSGFVVVESIGVVSSNTITDVYIKLRLSAGSNPIDMSNVVIEVMGESYEETLEYTAFVDDTDQEATSGSNYSVEQPISGTTDATGEIRDPDSYFTSSNPIVGQGALIMVHIDLSTALQPQDVLYIKIVPKHGAVTYEEIHTPEVLIGTYMVLD